MFSAIEQRLDLARRRIARKPLTVLVQWVCVHTILPFTYVDPTPSFVRMLEGDMRRRLRDLSDEGAFLYFGIHNSAELGDPPVSLRVVDDRGTVTVNERPLVAWIMGGGAGASGWRAPADLTLDDLR